MASIKFSIYRYQYSLDSNNGDLIREQRIALDPITLIPYIDVTAKFLQRVVSLPNDQKKIRAEKINGKERRSLVKYRKEGIVRETNRYIPFNNSAEIVEQLNETLLLPNVVCVDYYGESLLAYR